MPDFTCPSCGAAWGSERARDLCTWEDEEADRETRRRTRHRQEAL